VSLDTVIKKVAEREGVAPGDLRVRYRVAGGVPASLSADGVVGAREGADFVEVPPTGDGRAAVRLVQQERKPGKTDVAVEILKPDPDGVGAGKVVGRSSTAVDWVAPKLKLDVLAPKALAAGQEGTLTLVASNPGSVGGSAGEVAVRFDGFEVLPEEPPADRRGESEMRWPLPPLAAGGRKEIRMRVRAVETRTGELTAEARARTQDDLTASAQAVTAVGTAGLKVTVDPAVTASVGERVPVKVVVTNPGGVPLDMATAFVSFAAGLEHDTGGGQVEATVGVVPPGESRTVTVPLIARQPGKQWVKVAVRAGDLREQQETSVDVKRPDLKVVLKAPERMPPGAKERFEIGVRNDGDVGVPNVTVRLALPAGFRADEAGDGGTVGDRSVVWRVGDLAAGASQVLAATATAEKTADKAVVTATATSGSEPRPGDPRPPGGGGLSVKADASVTVRGQPALLLELADPQEPVPVGRRAGYRVVVRNQGSGPARAVKVVVTLPDELANVTGTGANREVVKPEGNKLLFPTVNEIPANGSATFAVEVQGAKPGDARVRAEVSADYLTKPLSEEQSTRVVDRR
jgi:uncharacterized membrane protein